VKTLEKAHAKFAASKMKTIMACPAMLGLAAKAPELPEHPAAVEGTLTHECLEAYNTRGDKKFNAITNALRKAAHPADRIDRAQRAHIRINEIRQGYPGADFFAEVKTDTSHFLEKGSFGTVDAAIVEMFGVLTVIDYKNGVMPVDPVENVQGLCYALGFGKLYDYHFDFVDITILQPNSRVAKRQESTWRAPIKEVLSWIPKFQAAVAATKVEKPKVNPGEWCYFCPAKNFNCPAHREKKVDRVSNVFKQHEEIW
jgi:hypothetical protein